MDANEIADVLLDAVRSWLMDSGVEESRVSTYLAFLHAVVNGVESDRFELVVGHGRLRVQQIPIKFNAPYIEVEYSYFEAYLANLIVHTSEEEWGVAIELRYKVPSECALAYFARAMKLLTSACQQNEFGKE